MSSLTWMMSNNFFSSRIIMNSVSYCKFVLSDRRNTPDSLKYAALAEDCRIIFTQIKAKEHEF